MAARINLAEGGPLQFFGAYCARTQLHWRLSSRGGIMKMKLGTLLGVMSAAALLFFGFRARTQAQENQDYQAIADKFFVLVEQGKSDDAIDYMFGTNVALKNLPGKS